jgi:hypothetical protein
MLLQLVVAICQQQQVLQLLRKHQAHLCQR